MCYLKGTSPTGHDRCSFHVREDLRKANDAMDYYSQDIHNVFGSVKGYNKAIVHAYEALREYASTPEGVAIIEQLSRCSNSGEVSAHGSRDNYAIAQLGEQRSDGFYDVLRPLAREGRATMLAKFNARLRPLTEEKCKAKEALIARAYMEAEKKSGSLSEEDIQKFAQSYQEACRISKEVKTFLDKIQSGVMQQQNDTLEVERWAEKHLPKDAHPETKRIVGEYCDEMKKKLYAALKIDESSPWKFYTRYQIFATLKRQDLTREYSIGEIRDMMARYESSTPPEELEEQERFNKGAALVEHTLHGIRIGTYRLSKGDSGVIRKFIRAKDLVTGGR